LLMFTALIPILLFSADGVLFNVAEQGAKKPSCLHRKTRRLLRRVAAINYPISHPVLIQPFRGLHPSGNLMVGQFRFPAKWSLGPSLDLASRRPSVVRFRCPAESSGHLRPILNRRILELALLVLRFFAAQGGASASGSGSAGEASIQPAESDPNPCAILGHFIAATRLIWITKGLQPNPDSFLTKTLFLGLASAERGGLMRPGVVTKGGISVGGPGEPFRSRSTVFAMTGSVRNPISLAHNSERYRTFK
jgi:hypothetical protein